MHFLSHILLDGASRSSAPLQEIESARHCTDQTIIVLTMMIAATVLMMMIITTRTTIYIYIYMGQCP
jgi:hypothetical protein